MWGIILLAIIIMLIAGFIWMSFAVCRFNLLQKNLPRSKFGKMLFGAFLICLLMLVLYVSMDFVNMVMVFLHLLIIWLICDAITWAIKKITKRSPTLYYSGICSIVFTGLWLTIGWYNAHHVNRTEYNLRTQKQICVSNFKIVGLSDSHVGATFHWQKFEEYIDSINLEHPDIVVIMGDFVDDVSSGIADWVIKFKTGCISEYIVINLKNKKNPK